MLPLKGHTVTVINQGMVESYNDLNQPVYGDPVSTVVKGSVQPLSSTEQNQYSQETSQLYNLYLDPTVIIDEKDTVLWNEQTWEVLGVPMKWTSSFSALNHFQCVLRLVRG